ncbi:MAG: hypothetical protein CMO55_26485 [Verrucomicrobiales bacterium]|nr:hypothetical protein [Verrucomicrobiales bacterium]
MSSEDILSALRQDTEQAITSLEKAPEVNIEEKIASLEQQMEEAAKIEDSEERELRMGVLRADFETLRGELQQEQEDLSQAVFGLNSLMNEMGQEYEDLMEPDESEKQVVAKAESAVKAAEANIIKIEDAPAWKFLLSSREKALREARAGLEKAQTGVETAQIRVKKMARDRLMKASIEESLQQFMFKVEKTIEIMEERRKEVQKQLESVSNRKSEAFRVKEQAAELLEKLDAELNESEGELQSREAELDTMVNGSPEYVAAEKDISALRKKVEEIRGRRNQALVLFQSKERFAAELDVHEKSQMKLRDNQDAWITLLKSDTEERLVTFRSRLEAMKAMSDQDVAQNLDNLGTAIDKSNVDFMAKVGSASDRRRMEMVESQPERIKKIEEARAAQAEAQARIREREHEALAQFRDKYNIDPLDSSFFTYTEDEGSTESQ